MIKYAKYLFITVCALCVYIMPVFGANTSCSTSTKKELAVASNYVKASYEIIDNSVEKTLEVAGKETTYKVPNYSFDISIYNLTEDLYVTVTPTNQKSFNVYYSDTVNGIYTFTDYNIGEIYNYTFMIRSNNSECSGTTLRTIRMTKPRYNAYSEFNYCQNSSSFYCQRFIGTEINISSVDEFLSKISVNNENNNPDRDKIDENKEIASIIKSNWKTYLLIFVGLAALVVLAIFGIRKYNEKKGWRL